MSEKLQFLYGLLINHRILLCYFRIQRHRNFSASVRICWRMVFWQLAHHVMMHVAYKLTKMPKKK